MLIISGQHELSPAAQVRLGHALAAGRRLFPPEDPGHRRPDDPGGVVDDEHDHTDITHLMFYAPASGGAAAMSDSPFP